MKKFLIPAIIIVLGIGLFLGWDSIQTNAYLSKNNITKEVKKETDKFLTTTDESDYLVYFYDKESCEKCGEYVKELQQYESDKESFSVYKVNLEKLDSTITEDALFMDKSQPHVIHVKGGEENYRYVGGFPADKLPNKTNKDEQL